MATATEDRLSYRHSTRTLKQGLGDSVRRTMGPEIQNPERRGRSPGFAGDAGPPGAVGIAGDRRSIGRLIGHAQQPFDTERKRQQENNAVLMKSDGTENPFKLWRELGDLMTKNVTVIRYNKNLQETDAELGVANPGFIRPGDTATAMPSDLARPASTVPVRGGGSTRSTSPERWCSTASP